MQPHWTPLKHAIGATAEINGVKVGYVKDKKGIRVFAGNKQIADSGPTRMQEKNIRKFVMSVIEKNL